MASSNQTRKTAAGLASLGRNGDSMLVHMTPGEVESLHGLASVAYGKRLSTNPKTGLPEASLLGSLAPMLVAGLATVMSGGTLGPLALMALGAGTGALTGDKKQSLGMRMGLGALGGLGGGGIGSAVSAAGGIGAAGAGAGAGAAAGAGAGAGAGAAAGAADALVNPAMASGALNGLGAATGAVPNVVAPAAAAAAPAAAAAAPTAVAPALTGTAFTAPTQTLPQAAQALGDTGLQTGTAWGNPVTAQPIPAAPTASPSAAPWSGNWDNAGANFQKAGSGIKTMMGSGPQAQAANAAYENAMPFGKYATYGAAAAPMIGDMLTPEKPYKYPTEQPTYYVGGQYHPGMQGSQFLSGQQGATPFIGQSYTPGTYTKKYPGYSDDTFTAAEGGSVPAAGASDDQARQYYMDLIRRGQARQQIQPPSPQALQDYMSNMSTQMRKIYTPSSTPTPTPSISTPVPSTPPEGLGFHWDSADVTGGAGTYNPKTQKYDNRGFAPQSFQTPFAQGGGVYAAGGKLVDGPGDGMSDSIPAVIAGQNPHRAALASGEFVIPADVVSHIGNGSTGAGARRLYGMMDKVRQARTGRKRQAPEVDPARFLPA